MLLLATLLTPPPLQPDVSSRCCCKLEERPGLLLSQVLPSPTLPVGLLLLLAVVLPLLLQLLAMTRFSQALADFPVPDHLQAMVHQQHQL